MENSKTKNIKNLEFELKKRTFPIVHCTFVKFIYSEKATKFCEISTSYVLPVKSKVEISPNFVAFSEYINFTYPTTIMARILINIQLKVLIPIQETTAGLVN